MGFSGFHPSNVLVAVLVLMFCQSSMEHNYYLLSPQAIAVTWLAAEAGELCEFIYALSRAAVTELGLLSKG